MPSMSGCPQTFFGGVHADPVAPVFCARSGAQSGRPTAVTSAAAAHTRCNRFRSILNPIARSANLSTGITRSLGWCDHARSGLEPSVVPVAGRAMQDFDFEAVGLFHLARQKHLQLRVALVIHTNG